MKFLDFRKYFFSYVLILIAYFCFGLIIKIFITDTPTPETDLVLTPLGAELLKVLFVLYCLIVGIILTILEILIRELIFKKFFPKFKLSLKLNFPEYLKIVHSIVFYFGLVLVFIFFIIFILLCLFK